MYTSLVEKLLDRVVSQRGLHLSAISSQKVCNAPSVVEDVSSQTVGGPHTWEEQAGYLATFTLLHGGVEGPLHLQG